MTYAALFVYLTQKYSIIAQDDHDRSWFVYLETNFRNKDEAINLADKLNSTEGAT